MIKRNDPKLEQALLQKSPHECTGRFVGYMEDDLAAYHKLTTKNGEDGRFIYSNRADILEEDLEAIENTTDFYRYRHLKEDDLAGVSHGTPPILEKENGVLTCRFCFKEFKSKKPFQAHEGLCRRIIESDKSHSIRFKHFMCYCVKCQSGLEHQCTMSDYSGEEQGKWLIRTSDCDDLRDAINREDETQANKKLMSDYEEALALVKNHKDYSPPQIVSNTKCSLKANHWKALATVLSLDVPRTDGKAGNARISDYQSALQDYGGWQRVFERAAELANKLGEEEEE